MEKLEISTERIFLRSPNINVCFRMVIAGIIDKNKFNTVMDSVCKKHPLIKCSIEIDKNHKAWFVPNTAQLEIEYYKSEELSDWQDWYTKKDNKPFDFLNGPLVKFCLIENPDKTEIILLGHHVIGDGVGYLNLVKDILLALDNRLETTPEITPIKKEKTGKSPFILPKLAAIVFNAIWRKTRLCFSEDDYRAFFEQYRKTYVPKRHMHTINEADLKKIIEKCKKNKFTVNGIITAAFSAALIELTDNYPDSNIRIGVVANIRNELETKPNYCMGNYFTGVSVKAKYSPKNSFITNTKNISKRISDQLNNLKNRYLAINFLSAIDKDLLESIVYGCYGNFPLPVSKKIGSIIGEGKGKNRLGISNLGHYEFSGYDTVKLLDMQFLSPTLPANLLSVSIITVNGKLNMFLLYNEVEMKDDVVELIYQRTMGLLLE